MCNNHKRSIFTCKVAGISVSMERGVGFGHKNCEFFESKSSPSGLENILILIKYPFLGFKKPPFGVNLVVKIPRLGTWGQGRFSQYPPVKETINFLINDLNLQWIEIVLARYKK